MTPQIKKFHVLFYLLSLLFLASCATTTIGKSYQTLYSAAVVYDQALTAAGDLYRAGKIDNQTKDEVIAIAKKYKQAVATGTTCLEQYVAAVQAKDTATAQGYKAQLTAITAAISGLEKILLTYIAEDKKQ